jgi:hypothetical protein
MHLHPVSLHQRPGTACRGATASTVANVPITTDPLGGDRPFLGGSPKQIADDLARLAGGGVDQVLFSNMAATGDVAREVGLLEELQTAAVGKT